MIIDFAGENAFLDDSRKVVLRYMGRQWVVYLILGFGLLGCMPYNGFNPHLKITGGNDNQEVQDLDIPHLELQSPDENIFPEPEVVKPDESKPNENKQEQKPSSDGTVAPAPVSTLPPTSTVPDKPRSEPATDTQNPNPQVENPSQQQPFPTNPKPPVKDVGVRYRLLWHNARLDAPKWSAFLLKSLYKEEVILNGARDVETFCPKYFSLTIDQRVNFWGLFISAVAKYESSFDPTARYVEKTMGVDPVTNKQVASEGLMQLSYQDTKNYKGCEFDWEQDKNLDVKDPRKTIFDPYKNLACSLRILSTQITKSGYLTKGSYRYWAVLFDDGRTSKVQSIRTIMKQAEYCQK